MITRKALFAACVASAALMTSSAWAGGFSFGFSYGGAPRYYSSYYSGYCAPSYVYYDTSPIYYADPAPVVVYAPRPRPVVYYPPAVVYTSPYPRYYRSPTVYTSTYRSYGHPRYSYGHSGYSYRQHDRSPRFRGGGRGRW